MVYCRIRIRLDTTSVTTASQPRKMMPLLALPPERLRPAIGIITALPEEYASVKALLQSPRDHEVPGRGAGRRYLLGQVPAANGGTHAVVLSLMTDMGNNIAGVRATLLLEHFPNVKSVIMVGIACGVPCATRPDDHVRLGDIVVSDRNGIIQYDFTKNTVSEKLHRHPPRPPSADLLEAVKLLQAGEFEGKRPWLKFIEQVSSHMTTMARPPQKFDRLYSSTNPQESVTHPKDAKRIKDLPRVFVGTIGAANILLKDAVMRDKLRDKFGVKAIEMEGSGISDATWYHDVGYLVVRGICDYGDSHKADIWHNYAALVAAAYTRALLESIEDMSLVAQPQAHRKVVRRSQSQDNVQSIYQLNAQMGDTQIRESLKRWQRVSTTVEPEPRVINGSIGFGAPEGTTFYLAPINPLANCRVRCQVRIIDDGGNSDNWVGFRIRGFAFDIRLGYLIYLRSSGRVELHRGHEIIAGTDEQVVEDTKDKWTEIRMDVFEDKIWLFVNNAPYRFIRDRKFCDEGHIYLHTFGTQRIPRFLRR